RPRPVAVPNESDHAGACRRNRTRLSRSARPDQTAQPQLVRGGGTFPNRGGAPPPPRRRARTVVLARIWNGTSPIRDSPIQAQESTFGDVLFWIRASGLRRERVS